MAQVDPNLWNSYARYYAQWLGFPSNFFIAQAMTESSYNPNTGAFRNVCNSWGSCGILQLQNGALQDMKRFYDLGGLNSLDPIQALLLAAAYMTVLDFYIKHYTGYDPLAYGDWRTLAVSYNGGAGAGIFYVRNGYAPNTSTRNYIAAIGNFSGQIG